MGRRQLFNQEGDSPTPPPAVSFPACTRALGIPHTNTHDVRTRLGAHRRAHTRTQCASYVCVCLRVHLCARANKRTRMTRTHACTPVRAHKHNHTHVHTPTHTLTQSLTDTHSHINTCDAKGSQRTDMLQRVIVTANVTPNATANPVLKLAVDKQTNNK